MAFTQNQITVLENAIATGALEVDFDGKRTRFRSLDEMMRIRDMMTASLATSTTSRFSLAAFTKDSSQPTRTTLPDPFGTNS